MSEIGIVIGADGRPRCSWGGGSPDYTEYHDNEWGRPVRGEHALFERYAGAVHDANSNGRITVLVSHRFSTVRMADLIVVLDGARVVEVGRHDQLLAKGGQYAQLSEIQAGAYR